MPYSDSMLDKTYIMFETVQSYFSSLNESPVPLTYSEVEDGHVHSIGFEVESMHKKIIFKKGEYLHLVILYPLL